MAGHRLCSLAFAANLCWFNAPAVAEPAVESMGEVAVEAQPVDDMEIARGLASWYGARFRGRVMADGQPFDPKALTAAHRTLPIGSLVRVRNLSTGQEVVVRINDRGPHVRGRLIDLSRAAAAQLGLLNSGVAAVVLLREPAP